MKLSKVLIFLALLLGVIALYWGLDKVFFQQDEWSGFGRAIYAQKYGVLKLIKFAGTHFTPITGLVVGLFYNLFYLNPQGYAVFSLILHALNCFLVFLIAQKLLKSNFAAFISSVVFLTAYTPSQAVTWYAASISFLPSAFFALLGLYMFEKFIETDKKKLLLAATIFVLVAILIRENAIFLFGYFIARMVILRNKNLKFILAIILLPAFVYGIIRFGPIIKTIEHNALSIIQQYVEFVVFYLSKLMLPDPFLRFLSNSISGSHLQFIKWEYWTRIVHAGAFVIFTLLLLLNSKKKTVLSMTIFLFLSIVPFSLLPSSYTLESRHFYLSAVSFSILLGYFCSKNIFKVLLVILFVLVNVYFVRIDLKNLISISDERMSFIKQFQNLYPQVPQKAIFLSQEDALPFQSGFGQMAMVILHDRNDYADLLGNSHLYQLTSRGYREEESVGFGYFDDAIEAGEELCNAGLGKDNLLSFSWNHESKTLTDTSASIRLKISCN